MTDMKTEKLNHKWCETNERFFERIDACGGWPVGMRYVSFEHATERLCEFGNEYLNTGWWTTVASADDYYLWKLSDAAIKKLKFKLRNQLISQLSNMKDTP